MKLLLLFLLFASYNNTKVSALIESLWDFVEGNTLPNVSYVLDSNYSFPASRYYNAYQTGCGHEFLIYGGNNPMASVPYFSDMWIRFPNGSWVFFNPVIWLQNSPGQCDPSSPPENPPNLYAINSWINGTDFWIYGGISHFLPGNKYMNGLWKLDTTNLSPYLYSGWTYVGGNVNCGAPISDTTTTPSTRTGAITWVCNEELYLFGGNSKSGLKNDIWKFNGTTWILVFRQSSLSGNYVDQGIPSNQSYPGARYYASGWLDDYNNLWLYGGTNGSAVLDDLWRFGNDSLWTWFYGNYTTVNQPAVYAQFAAFNETSTPGGRQGTATWLGDDGTVWLFGGQDGSGNLFNDLWAMDTSDQEWAWVSGSYQNYNTSIYYPGARSYASGFSKNRTHFYLFGGRAVAGG